MARPGTAASREVVLSFGSKRKNQRKLPLFRRSGPATKGLHAPWIPKVGSQRARATRTQYYCSRLTPAPSAPFRNSGVPPNPRRGEREAPLSKGAGCVSGLGDSDGLCVAAHSRATSVHCKGAGCRPPLPLSFATHSQQSVGAGHARPATLLCPRQRAEPFRPASRPPPLKGEASLAGFARAKGSSRSGVTPRCAGRCREATEGFGSEGLAEPTRPEGL